MKTERNPFRRILAGLPTGPTARTLVFALILTVVMGSLRPPNVEGLHSDEFNARKVHWVHNADLVAAGDSRTMCALAPEALAEVLGPLRVRNFGFAAAGLTDEYLDAIHNVLDPDAKLRIILLGITPATLSETTERRNCYADIRRSVQSRSIVTKTFTPVLEFFEPMKFSTLRKRLIPPAKTRKVSIKNRHPDGWIACTVWPDQPMREVNNYRDSLPSNRLSSGTLDRLLLAIRQWRAEGIVVYAFRPPTNAEMEAVEAEFLHFDEAAFIAQFTQAGGVWIPIDSTGYHTYDGSHQVVDGALALSTDVGRFIRRHLQPGQARPASERLEEKHSSADGGAANLAGHGELPR